jgi:hypothetical protein
MGLRTDPVQVKDRITDIFAGTPLFLNLQEGGTGGGVCPPAGNRSIYFDNLS